MSQPYVGQLLLAGFNFAPVGWAFCQGQLVPISENPTLFQLIGTTYGGDGQSTFALPDLRGRLAVHQGQGVGSNYTIGEIGGVETVTLTLNQIPVHNHLFGVSNASAASPHAQGNVPALTSNYNVYHGGPANAGNSMTPPTTNTGNSQPHDNLQPYLCLNWCISLFGIFPSQN